MSGVGLPPLRAVRVDGLRLLAGATPSSDDLADHVIGSMWTFTASGGLTWVSGRDAGAASILVGNYARRGSCWEFTAAGQEMVWQAVRQVRVAGTVELAGDLFRVTMTRALTVVVQLPRGAGTAVTTTILWAALTAVPLA